MNVDDIKKIAVCGAGLMGHGIALEIAAAGYSVGLYDLTTEFLDRGMARMRAGLQCLVEDGRLPAGEIEAAVARITPSTDLAQAAGDADIVIEAVAERLEVKQELFGRLDAICPPRTILASNSSTLMPSSLAPATRRPDRVLVAHYWNPPYLLPVVEILGSSATSAETIDTVYALMQKIGKKPVILRKEVVGFIGNRLQFALFREALHLVESGVATHEDVDAVVRNSLGRRLAVAGPFQVFDLAGYDVIYNGCSYVFPDLSNVTEPQALLRERVERGELGVKTGRGFYDWTPETAEALRRRVAETLAWLNARDQGGPAEAPATKE